MSQLLTAADWQSVLEKCRVAPAEVLRWAPVFAETIRTTTFSQGVTEVDEFLGQTLHESGMLKRLVENLNYSASRLCLIWPNRFPTINDALPYHSNPEALANRVYGGRMGNTQPGDGWRFKGRGLMQITGRDNYRMVGDLMGQDLIGLPTLLEQPRFALEAAIAFWEKKIPDRALGDSLRITRIINGGTHGLDDRIALATAARKALA